MRPLSEAFVSTVALVAMARLIFPWGNGSTPVPRRQGLFGEQIVGIVADITVLALGIFMVVTACVGP
jgi:hypothetical protein